MRGRWLSGVVAVLAALSTITPGLASAADAGGEPAASAIFQVRGSNGYSLAVFAGSKRADGKGRVSILVASREGFATYTAEATVTASGLTADLGSLGAINLEYVSLGTKEARYCGEEATVPRGEYRGRFAFYGEEDYTRAEVGTIPSREDLYLRMLCPGAGFGDSSGPGLPGARLDVSMPSRVSRSFKFEAKKNGPAARTKLSVEVRERRGGIDIARGTEALVDASAFRFAPDLRTAMVDPPSPFGGTATYSRAASSAGSWRGDLTVDLPGYSDYPLVRAGVRTSLVRAQWSQSS